MQVAVSVTTQCIQEGKPKNSTRCGFALACLETFQNVEVAVTPYEVTMYRGGWDDCYPLCLPVSPVMHLWLTAFDRGEVVQPITTVLDVPADFYHQYVKPGVPLVK